MTPASQTLPKDWDELDEQMESLAKSIGFESGQEMARELMDKFVDECQDIGRLRNFFRAHLKMTRHASKELSTARAEIARLQQDALDVALVILENKRAEMEDWARGLTLNLAPDDKSKERVTVWWEETATLRKEIAELRERVIEECADLAMEHSCTGYHENCDCRADIASAIRALAKG